MPHLNYYIDNTVEVFVVCKGRVLLRKHDKYGIWLSVGGHVEPDEDLNEAAIREVKEEVGLDVELVPTTKILNSDSDMYKHLVTPAFINRHNIKEKHEHVTSVFFAKTDNEEVTENDREKSEGWKWFTAEEIKESDEIRDTIKEYANTALSVVNEHESN